MYVWQSSIAHYINTYSIQHLTPGSHPGEMNTCTNSLGKLYAVSIHKLYIKSPTYETLSCKLSKM